MFVLVATMALVAAGERDTWAQKQPKASGGISAAQPSKVNRVLAQFRMAGKDVEKRAAAVAEAEAVGPAAVSALLTVILREMAPEMKRYGAKFCQKAAIAVQAHVGKVDYQEVARLRETVLGLQKLPNFTHEIIVAKGDPAMKRLAEIFVVDRSDVLKRFEELGPEREKLFVLGRLWERCAKSLHQASEGPDKPKEPPSFEKYLQGEEELATGMATPMDRTTKSILSANARLAPQIDPEEAKSILALNLTRNLLGLSALAIDLKLCAAGRDHAKDMQELHFFAHESPVDGKKTPWDRAKRFGTSASGENICMGVSDGKTANQLWFDSPGHHTNMLANHNRVGVGRCGTYFAQEFGN